MGMDDLRPVAQIQHQEPKGEDETEEPLEKEVEPYLGHGSTVIAYALRLHLVHHRARESGMCPLGFDDMMLEAGVARPRNVHCHALCAP